MIAYSKDMIKVMVACASLDCHARAGVFYVQSV